VLLAAVQQPIVAAMSGMGDLAAGAAPAYPTYIQPASWAFSIWGFIYLASIAFAIYQVIPKNDNQLLRAVRIPALIAFLGSSLWLYFAASVSWTIWLTIPTLIVMAGALAYIVAQPALPAATPQLFSYNTLLPYAAWTGIAQWLNVVALMNAQNVISTGAQNTALNVFFLLCIAGYTIYWLRRAQYSIWYGGVIIWASIGVIAANTGSPEGSIIITTMAGALGLAAMALIRQNAGG
tara:strand:+ start:1695 stop:2402 length:708 start_codon:yes stop_codon:yes gene_type:complete